MTTSRLASFLACIALATCRVHPANAQVVDPNFWIADGAVRAWARVSDTLYIGGDFTYVGPPTGAFAALDSASGAPLPGWPRVTGTVQCAAADGAGGWYIGGRFTAVGGVARRNLAHLRGDGSLDTWDPGASDEVRAIAVSGARVFVGGLFDLAGGAWRPHLAALDASTGFATSWAPAVDGVVNALLVHQGALYAGGGFTQAGGRSRQGLAALDPASGLATEWSALVDGTVNALAGAGDVLYVGGEFSRAGGQLRQRAAAIDSRNGLAFAWNPEPDGTVRALALRAGVVYAGGSFTAVGGQARRALAALDATTGSLLPFDQGLNGNVYSLAATDRAIHAGGDFTHTAAGPRRCLAAFDPSSGAVLAWSPGADATVYVVAPGVQGVFAGGAFRSSGGLQRDHLAAIDLRTGAGTSWASSASHPVTSMVARDGVLYVAGNFGTLDGLPRSRVGAVHTHTGRVTSFAPPAPDAPPSDLAASETHLLAVGTFLNVGPAARHGFVAFDRATGADAGWLLVPSSPGKFNAVAVVTGRILLGGEFGTILGNARPNLAAISPVTGQLQAWNPAPNAGVFGLLGAGDIAYVSGYFSQIGGLARSYVAALDVASGQATSFQLEAINYAGVSLLADGLAYVKGPANSFPWATTSEGWATVDPVTGAGRTWHAGRCQSLLAADPAWVVANDQVDADALPGSVTRRIARFLVGGPALAPYVSLLAPVGGEWVTPGDTITIRWDAGADARGVQSLDLWLSRTGADGPWEPLAAALTGTGVWSWPVQGPFSDDCRVRADMRNWDGIVSTTMSPASFTISSEPGPPTPQAAHTAVLDAPRPNPARGRSQLAFDVPERADVRIELYDVQGRAVATLAAGSREPGRHVIGLDTSALPAGLYFARMRTGATDLRQRLVVVK